MRTTILAYGIALVGLVTMALGLWGLFILAFERPMRVRLRPSSRVPIPALRYYAAAIGMISGGLGLIGLAQALRLLAEILTTGAAVGAP
jgi:hypothetical protein